MKFHKTILLFITCGISIISCDSFEKLKNSVNLQDSEELIRPVKGVEGSYFSTVLSISGNYLIAGTSTNASGEGERAYIFKKADFFNWEQIEELSSPDGEDRDFGSAVAIDGEWALVGQEETEITNTGRVFFYRKASAQQWELAQQFDIEGYSLQSNVMNKLLAISGDYAFVGASDYYGENRQHGAVHVFKKDQNNSWQAHQILLPSNADDEMDFGHALALHNSHAVIASARRASSENQAKHHAFIFELSADAWTEIQSIEASDNKDNTFGSDLAIYGDTIVAAMEDKRISVDGDEYYGAGGAYIFHRQENGSWLEVQSLIPQSPYYNLKFAASVAINSSYIVIGEPYKTWEGNPEEDIPTFYSAGIVYLYKLHADGTVELAERISASDKESNDIFGFSSAMSDTHILIGSPKDGGKKYNPLNAAGAAYIYSFQGNGGGLPEE